MFQRKVLLRTRLQYHPFAQHITPLLQSHVLSAATNCDVWLKMDVLRPSGSFKDRGIGNLMHHLKLKHGKKARFVSSSGGNAGYAATVTAKQLGVNITVVVPTSTKPMMIQKIKSGGAEVIIHGENWDAADQLTQELCQEEGVEYVPPFDHPLLWEGHAGLVYELKQQLPHNLQPDAILCCVGGGGLLGGIMKGVKELGWQKHTKIITAETYGAESFALGMSAVGRTVELPAIGSIATSLGSRKIPQAILDEALAHKVQPFIVSDSQAVSACLSLLDDHRVFVEPACGATLALLYDEKERKQLLDTIHNHMATNREKPVVVVEVCGGNIVNRQLMEQWKQVDSHPGWPLQQCIVH